MFKTEFKYADAKVKKVKCIPQTEENFYGENYVVIELNESDLHDADFDLYKLFKLAENKAKTIFGDVPMAMEMMK